MKESISLVDIEDVAIKLDAIYRLVNCVASEAEGNIARASHYAPALNYIGTVIGECCTALRKAYGDERSYE